MHHHTMTRMYEKSRCTRSQRLSSGRRLHEWTHLAFVGLVLLLSVHSAEAIEKLQAMTGEKKICAGHHQLVIPAGARAKFATTYAGLKVKDEGRADWDSIVASLRDRADEAKSSPSPRTPEAE